MSSKAQDGLPIPKGISRGLGRLIVTMFVLGMALNTNIEVAFRPVTNQGMKGAAPSTAGPRRQVSPSDLP